MIKKIIRILVVLSLIGLSFYPMISNWIYDQEEKQTLGSWEQTMKYIPKEDLEDQYAKAKQYNERLYAAQSQGYYIGDIADYYSLLSLNYDGQADSSDEGQASSSNGESSSALERVDEELNEEAETLPEGEESQADPSNGGTSSASDDFEAQSMGITNENIMGRIVIPKIDVDLPFYHGTDEEILSNGIGHFRESSLPVGGKNTRAVLSGHRGLVNAKMFTRLDEMREGDLFFINVLNKTLAYEVCEIEVIEPEEVSAIEIEEGKDLVTLLTCTPFGINTQRLLVTGERVAFDPTMLNIGFELPSLREMAFFALPFLLIFLFIWQEYSHIRHDRKLNKYDAFRQRF